MTTFKNYMAITHERQLAWTAEFMAEDDDLAFATAQREAEWYGLKRVELYRREKGFDISLGRVTTSTVASSFSPSGVPRST